MLLVRDVGGAPPEDFDQIARRYVASSSFARRTAGAKVRAAWHLLRAVATRAPDIEAAERRTGTPGIAHAKPAVDSDSWRGTHVATAVELS